MEHYKHQTWGPEDLKPGDPRTRDLGPKDRIPEDWGPKDWGPEDPRTGARRPGTLGPRVFRAVLHLADKRVEYSLVNNHQSLNASNFIKLCNVSFHRDLLQASTNLEHTIRIAMHKSTKGYCFYTRNESVLTQLYKFWCTHAEH